MLPENFGPRLRVRRDEGVKRVEQGTGTSDLVNAETQPFDGARAQPPRFIARALVVGLNEHGVHLQVTRSNFKTRRQLIQKFFDDALADEVIDVISSEEFFEEEPYKAYTDFSGVTEIHLKIGHVFQIAQHRREASGPAKSAFFADTFVGFGIARLYEELMKDSMIQVQAFRERATAAAWLEAPVEILLPK